MKGNMQLVVILLMMALSINVQYALAQNAPDISDVKFEIVCNDTVGVNEQIHVTYVLDYGDQFNPDSLELKLSSFETDCARLLYIGKSGTSTSISVLNGKLVTSHKIKWDANIRTVKQGRILTPDVLLQYKKDTLDIPIEPKIIIITRDNHNSSANQLRNDTEEKSIENLDSIETEIIRLVTILDKETVNLGDSVIMQVKLQSNQNFSEVRFDTPIEIDDCFYEQLETNFHDPFKTNVEGLECYEWTIYELMLFPLKSGVIKIPEIKIKGNYRVRKEISDPYFGLLPQFFDVPFRTQSKEINLKVE